MIYAGARQRAIRFLRNYVAHRESVDGLRKLIFLYREIGDWREAEKVLLAHENTLLEYLPQSFGEIAITAGKSDATADALRLWRLRANLDRSNLEGLDELAKTSAGPQLRALYLQLKLDDPRSTAPDRALRILR